MRKRVLTTIGTVGLLLMCAGCGKAGEFYEKGQESVKTGDYENALLYFSQAVEENPNKAEYYLEQGYSLAALGRYEEARKSLSSAVVERDLELTRKNNKRAWRAIGITYTKKGSTSRPSPILIRLWKKAFCRN
ncbi:MAG: tetratricopeptide repeat protein [Lachnospiraceae bacterium]|nr:tetratricopeptide repeat protein [Lachnospiraceae bacterium]